MRETPVYCQCGHRMIPGVYSYNRKNRKRAWFCTRCGRLVRLLRMSDGKQLPVPIWQGRRVRRRRSNI